MSNTPSPYGTTITVNPSEVAFQRRHPLGGQFWTEDELVPGDVLADDIPAGATGHVRYNAFDGDIIRIDEYPTTDGRRREVVTDIGVLDVPQGARLTITYRGNREAWRAAQGVTQ